MHKTLLKLAPVIALGFATGGCQLFNGGNGMARTSEARPEAAVAANFGELQLEEGRAALLAGRTADALEAFMLAKAFPEQAPAAYNGLAVAYSRLGRADLSERFFRVAVALAPQDDRYRANLARFYTTNGMTRSTGPVLALAPVDAAPEPPAAPAVAQASVAQPSPVRTLGAGVSVQAAPRIVRRISAAEVHVGSGPAVAAPRSAPVRRAVIEVGRSQPAAAYPIRVTLAAPKPVESTTAPAYPIRIPLGD